jgi:uncharacterized protein YcnI
MLKKTIIAASAALIAAVATITLAHAVVRTDMGLTESKVGTYETYRLQVPVEKPMATTEVKLYVPAGLTVSTFGQLPGWQRSVEKDANGLITTVTWKGKIEPEEFARFMFSAKNPAAPTTLLFKVDQTYADGTVVKWADEDPKGKTPASRVEIK